MNEPPNSPTPVQLVAADLSWFDVFRLSFKFTVAGVVIALAIWLPLLLFKGIDDWRDGNSERRANERVQEKLDELYKDRL